jgi:hypothetical protein
MFEMKKFNQVENFSQVNIFFSQQIRIEILESISSTNNKRNAQWIRIKCEA